MFASRLRYRVYGKASWHLARAREMVADASERRQGARPPWPNHVLFVAGMPKSGTTWLAELLEQVRPYRRRGLRDPDRCAERHDVCDAIFDNLPPDLYTVLKLHTRCTPANLRVIERHGLKTVVMHRDLRDQSVSRYFHILEAPWHPEHERYLRLSKGEALDRAVESTIEQYKPWIEDWQGPLSAFPDRFHELRYEELRRDTPSALARVLAFYDVDLPDAEIRAAVERVGERTRFELKARDVIRGKATARAGRVGGWQEHLEPHHVERLQEACGGLLADPAPSR